MIEILWKFSRPHTIKATFLATTIIYIICQMYYQGSFISSIGYYLIALTLGVLANIAVVGFNQIMDIETDRRNKPFLPIAAGLLSRKNAILVVILVNWGVLLVGGAMTMKYGHIYYFILMESAILLAQGYSLPLIRHSNFFVIYETLAISLIRGFILNFLLFKYYTYLLNLPGPLPAYYLSLSFFPIYCIAIAWLKDIPDIGGDKDTNIKTLSVLIGVKNVITMSLFVLILSYLVSSIGCFWVYKSIPASLSYLIFSFIAFSIAYYYYKSLDLNAHDGQVIYYKKIWQLFYLQYWIILFVSLIERQF